MLRIVYIVFGILLLATHQLVAQVVAETIPADKRDVLNRWSKNHLTANEKVEKPNVIFILTDDQGYGDFSVHGNPILKTPELDKLHSESIRFNSFHVAPLCTPSRGELMTGMDAMKKSIRYQPRFIRTLVIRFFVLYA